MKRFPKANYIFLFIVCLPLIYGHSSVSILFPVFIACLFFLFYLLVSIQKQALFQYSIADILVVSGIVAVIGRYFCTPFRPPVLLWESIVFLAAYLAIRLLSCKEKLVVLYGFILSGFLQSILGILQRTGFLASNHPYFPVTGTFLNPGPYGGYVAVCLVIAFFTLRQSSWKHRALIFPVLTAGLLVSDSRASWLAAGVPLLFYVLSGFKKRRLVACLLFVAVTGVFIYGLYRYRPESADSRLTLWRVTARMIADAPLKGHGPGSYAGNYMLYQADYFREFPERSPDDIGNNVHSFNEPLRWFAEYGAAAPCLLLILSLILYKNRGKTSAAVLYGLPAWFVFSLFSYPGSVFPLGSMVPVLLGMAETERTYSFPVSGTCRVGATVILLFMLSGSVGQQILFCRADKLMERIREGYIPTRCEKQRLIALPACREAYGQYLAEQDDPAEEIAFLEMLLRFGRNSEIQVRLAESYARAGKHKLAEESFILASRMVPTLVLPRYRLFEFYLRTGQEDKAYVVAEEISGMNEKITNSITIRAKADARKYIKRYENQNTVPACN